MVSLYVDASALSRLNTVRADSIKKLSALRADLSFWAPPFYHYSLTILQCLKYILLALVATYKIKHEYHKLHFVGGGALHRPAHNLSV